MPPLLQTTPAVPRATVRQQQARQAGIERSTARVAELNDTLHDHAHRAQEWETTAAAVRAERTALDSANPDEASTSAQQKAVYFVVLCGLAAVPGIDILLLGPTAEYLVAMGFPGSPLILNAGKVLVPVGLLLLELAVSKQRLAAREEAAISGRNTAVYGWIFVGILFALVMPGLVVATVLARISTTVEPGATLPAFHTSMLGALVLLSFVGHAGVLFGGELVRDSLGQAIYSVRAARLRHLDRRATANVVVEQRSADATFRRYWLGLTQHNQLYPEAQLGAGPFSRAVYDVINGLHPNTILPAPADGETAPPQPAAVQVQAPAPAPTGAAQPPEPAAAAAAPPQAPADGPEAPDAEVEYLRTVLQARVQEADSEVQP